MLVSHALCGGDSKENASKDRKAVDVAVGSVPVLVTLHEVTGKYELQWTWTKARALWCCT